MRAYREKIKKAIEALSGQQHPLMPLLEKLDENATFIENHNLNSGDPKNPEYRRVIDESKAILKELSEIVMIYAPPQEIKQ